MLIKRLQYTTTTLAPLMDDRTAESRQKVDTLHDCRRKGEEKGKVGADRKRAKEKLK